MNEDKLSGGDNNYYLIPIPNPKRLEPYVAEVEDIIEALEMTFAEATVLKSLVRAAAGRQGRGKPGNTYLYDAQKIVYYGNRMIAHARKADDYNDQAAWLLQSIAKNQSNG